MKDSLPFIHHSSLITHHYSCRFRRAVLTLGYNQGVKGMRYYATRIPAVLITFVLGLASANLGAYVGLGSSDERDVLAVEREYVRAHVERDVAALDRVLADDFSMFGGRITKEHRLALISNPFFAVTSLKTEGVEVVVNGRENIV